MSFSVDEKYRLPRSVRALIRYENLTGDRYVDIEQGEGDPDDTLPSGATIPIGQTEPAMDLDKLLGGFKPLFRHAEPRRGEPTVGVADRGLQAERQREALTNLLAQTSSFTGALADRDQLIGDVIDNLNQTLGILDGDKKGLDTSLRLQQLITGLSAQRGTIGNALTQTAAVTNGLSGLLGATRPDLKQIVAETGTVSATC